MHRIRVSNREAQAGDQACPHCGTKFVTPKAHGRHFVQCNRRRLAAGLATQLQTWHDVDPSADAHVKARSVVLRLGFSTPESALKNP